MRLRIGLLFLCVVAPLVCLAAVNQSMDEYCDIQADDLNAKMNKIIRLNRLAYVSSEALPGETECKNGDRLSIIVRCVGTFQVAVFSISGRREGSHLKKATRLFHLYSGGTRLRVCEKKEE